MYCRCPSVSNAADGQVRSRCENRGVNTKIARVGKSNRRRVGAWLVLALLLFVPGCAGSDGSGSGDERPQRTAGSKKAGQDPADGRNAGRGESGRDGAAGAAKGGGEPGEPAVAALLEKLKVSAEVEKGYDRDLFYHWQVLDGCDVRDRVLARQDRRNGPCGADSGRWYSAYDGERTSDPGDFDVDHMVPLAEAWASGARRWPEARRDDFANDLRPYSLIAVSASSNRSKSDQDPAEWMPDNTDFACRYVARWIAVKFRWSLSVDAREKGFLEDTLSGCRPADLRIRDTIARVS